VRALSALKFKLDEIFLEMFKSFNVLKDELPRPGPPPISQSTGMS
jgi:hypothetical protein